ncbi:MAG: hypothetical protein Kow0042_27890 [Calditrichia bacterium]
MEMAKQTLQELKARLYQKEKELYSIQKIGQALSHTLNLDDLLSLVMKETTELMNADRSTLFLVDQQKQEIWSKIAQKAEVKEIRQKIGKGISGVVAATGETINIPDAYLDARFDPTTDKRTGYRTRSILCMPVWEPTSKQRERHIQGVIQVLNKKDGTFTPEDEGILEAIAGEVAVAISNARLFHQLEKKYREIDLLYEFEQMLSAEFDIREVLKSILRRTSQHLRGGFAGAIYPLEGKHYLLFTDESDTVYSEVLGSLRENFRELLQKGGDLRSPKNQKIVLESLPGLSTENLENVALLPVQLKESIEGAAAVMVKTRENQSFDLQADDRQLLEIVGQKIARALELHSLRDTLLKQERLSAIGQMMSTIVHDLRNPINSVYGFMDLLLETEVTEEEKKEYGEIIRAELQSITNMTTEILDFAKGKTSILPRKCSVKNIITRFKPQAEQLFRMSGIRFKLQSESKKLVYADVEKFTRVLYNIAKNAKEAMGETGEFLLKTYDQPEEVIFQLSDTGPGIPEDIRDRLFESFVSSGKERGTGLGLAIVKKIVEDHHGTIEIQSKVNEGTTFFIRLPEYRD